MEGAQATEPECPCDREPPLERARALAAEGQLEPALALLERARDDLPRDAIEEVEGVLWGLRLDLKARAGLDLGRPQRAPFGSPAPMQELFTSLFGFRKSDYDGRRILDVDCGPVGSLEWADNAALRVGLDPLACGYRDLGVGHHRMQYVQGRAEAIPLPDESFDFVSSLRSLERVDDLTLATRELIRVLRPGGWLLLATDAHEAPGERAPESPSWALVEHFLPELALTSLRHLERPAPAARGSGHEVLSALFYKDRAARA